MKTRFLSSPVWLPARQEVGFLPLRSPDDSAVRIAKEMPTGSRVARDANIQLE